MSVERLAPHFRRCDEVGTVDNGVGVANEVQGQPIVICRGLVEPWPRTWEKMRFLS